MTPISIKAINSRTSRRINALATNANLCMARLDNFHKDLIQDFTEEHGNETNLVVYRTKEDSHCSALRFRFKNGQFIQGTFSPATGWSWQCLLLSQVPNPEYYEDFYQVIFLSLLTTWLLEQFNKQ